MSLEIIIISLYIVISCLIMIRFFINRKKIKSTFTKINKELLNDINRQKRQINDRQERLKLYDFLVYNIEDVLIAQTKIII